MFRTALISMFLTSTALADTWTVDDDGKADFDNIQAAVDASSDGDEIVVMPGTYTGSGDDVVRIADKSVSLVSKDGLEQTIIDGEGKRKGIYCSNSISTLIDGFTITNCRGTESDNTGGGMRNSFSNPIVTNCMFTYNNAGSGAGMANWESSPTLTNCTFMNNTARTFDPPGGTGGGMFNYLSSPTLTSCTFRNNSAYEDGGGMYNNDSSPTLTDCAFTNNTTIIWDGGGMFNNYSSPTLTNCTFTDNHVPGDGGGIYNWTECSPILTNCTFADNTANYKGGGMLNDSVTNPTIINCTFTNNAAISGGGMHNSNSTHNPTLTDTTVCGNSPDQIQGNWTDGGGNTVADECPECPDINGDGYVNVSDLLAVIDQWGLTDSPADVTGDGVVNVSDVLLVISNWGPCE